MIFSLTVFALYAAYRGNAEAPYQFLLLSGAVVLLIDLTAGRLQRRKARAAKRRAGGSLSSKK
jgi:hypothetical protein